MTIISAIPSAMLDISAGKYINVFELTIALHFYEVSHTPTSAAL